MSATLEIDAVCPRATDGDIAAVNLNSARRQAWKKFERGPRHLGVVEEILDEERLASQFFGDLGALERMEALAARFAAVDTSFCAALVEAEVASAVHRFEDARRHLARAASMGAPCERVERHALTIDQACGLHLDEVLDARRRIAAASDRLEDWVPLGAVMADLERFADADAIYRRALSSYDSVSPFPPAWVCLQLGQLWGELVSRPEPTVAAFWYRRALDYLPRYVKARVHLAEIRVSQGETSDAEALLVPALSSHDPEVRWRLAEALFARRRFEEADAHLDAARATYEDLLLRHPLAFADHAAEFYAASGGDHPRALELALLNLANRPTRRARRQVDAIRAALRSQDRTTT